MIDTGVSKNRIVVSLPDGQLAFLAQQAGETGLGRAHVVRTAVALLQARVERAAAIEEAALQNEGAC